MILVFEYRDGKTFVSDGYDTIELQEDAFKFIADSVVVFNRVKEKGEFSTLREYFDFRKKQSRTC